MVDVVLCKLCGKPIHRARPGSDDDGGRIYYRVEWPDDEIVGWVVAHQECARQHGIAFHGRYRAWTLDRARELLRSYRWPRSEARAFREWMGLQLRRRRKAS